MKLASIPHIRTFLFVATLAVVALFNQYQLLVFGILCIFAFTLLYVDGFRLIKSYILIGIAGPVSEMICIASGAWSYSDPVIFGIPIWLPLVWGNCGICFIHIATRFNEIKVK